MTRVLDFLENLSPEVGEEIVWVTNSGNEYPHVFDGDWSKWDHTTPSWFCPNRVGGHKKKGYAKWISRHE